MASPYHASTRTTAVDKLAALEQTYPAWHIKRKRGAWSAKRANPPTVAQAAAGVHALIIQPTMEALAAVLAQQMEIAQRVR